MDHGHDMPGMGNMAPPSMNSTNSTGGMMMHHHKMMMHMTFFWGSKAEILFSGWPGAKPGMYVLALLFVFVLAFLVECLSHCQLIKSETRNLTAGLIQTLLHCLRVGLAYLVMLAVMSFNAGVFLVAVAGHSLGFLVFGSRVFKNEKNSDLPPMSC